MSDESPAAKHGKFRSVWVGPYMVSWQWSPDGVWVKDGKRMPFCRLGRALPDDGEVDGWTLRLGPLVASIGWNVVAATAGQADEERLALALCSIRNSGIGS